MFSFFRSQPHYVVVADGEYRDEDKTSEPPQPVMWSSVSRGRISPWAWALGVCALVGIGVTSTLAAVKSAQAAGAKMCPSTGSPACSRPTIRREWRTLAHTDRNAYIAAVQCLALQPSKVHTNGSLYDDFPRVHQATAPTAHKAAPFLPWHRYFVHAYETALKEQCRYLGAIPYVFLLVARS